MKLALYIIPVLTVLPEACGQNSSALQQQKERFSTGIIRDSATSDEQTAYPYYDKEHGLFTYFLLKKLKETQGKVTYGEPSDYVNKQVKRQSVVINNKRQTPTVIPSATMLNTWQELKLK